MKEKRQAKTETVTRGNIKVRIYKRQRRKSNGDGKRTVYEVADYSTGTRRFRGFTDHKEARDEATRIADRMAAGQVAAAQLRNTDADSLIRSREILKPTGASLEYAATVFAKCFALVGDKAIQACEFFNRHDASKVTAKLVPEVLNLLLEVKKSDGASNDHLKDLKYRCGRFAKSFAVDISSVTTGDVQTFLDGLGLSKQSKKNFRTTLHSLFEFAEARGFIFKGGNPVVATEAVKVQNGNAIQIFTVEEITKLLKNASRELVPVLAIGAFAGLRATEIERLEWKDIDSASGLIHISADNAKTRSRRLVPLLPNLVQWLKDYSGKTGRIWKGNENDLYFARGETVKAAGVPWKDNGLRHSFISYRLADIQDAAKTALEAGNSPDMVFKHYRELVKPDQARAWFEITPETVKETK